MLADACGRTVRYLRLSVTAECAMRCLYCRPEHTPRPAAASALSATEIESVVRYLVAHHGLRKVRLTGGEPTARSDLLELVARLARLKGLDDLAMTTNGLRLATLAGPLADAGLGRVNISLDSLDPTRFRRLTGCDGLARVKAGILAARAAGLAPLKLNAVVLAGENERELAELVRYAADVGAEMRFIELMPMGPLAARWAERHVDLETMQRRLHVTTRHWRAWPLTAGSARRWSLELEDGRAVTVGFISPMSCPFCEGCDRLRLASDGSLYGCLMGPSGANLLSAVRPVFEARRLDAALRQALVGKAALHPPYGVTPMVAVGG